MPARRDHWEKVYRERGPDTVSWYQDDPALSVALIQATGAGPEEAILDAGGGASRLVDALVAAGYRNLTVLDISANALRFARERLGPTAGDVTWVQGDVTEHPLDARFRVWHDRAVFHFLTEAEDRARYVGQVADATDPGADVFIAAFGIDGPERCSGLPVARYSAETMASALGPRFELLGSEAETHHTPTGSVQQFLYCHFRRADP